MKFYQKLENTVAWNKPVDEQLEALSQYDHISEDEILELLQCVKWYEAGILIEYLGPEKLKDYLPQVLEFLQDMNWPGSFGASKMLKKSGRAIVPEIKRVFREVAGDTIWHYWILHNIVEGWDAKLICELKPELIVSIERADWDGASIMALSILKGENLISSKDIEAYYRFLLQEYEGNEDLIKELNEEIEPFDKNQKY